MVARAELIRESLLLTAEECAALAGVGVATWWRRDAAGLCPRAIRIGRTTRWRRAELLAWIEAGCPRREEWERQRTA